ncbi:fasciclin domain-containing protein [Pontibacter silvestris]|uniref:Fasciclin domain-containing protein n=1 Tax=Pontibacter silvestris TaxID=2305183 RepID=A0ABW4X2Q9_9BACT|nr:fasciclin domain-containing protein [Pontibacter silvestris]MCC9135102.1 fasciclin domain-containing protein [Pontibacter silvestris]
MKKIILNPLAAMVLAAFTMYGCASSNENLGTTAMGGTSMSETATMAGNASDTNRDDVDVLVVEEQAVVPVATLSVTALTMDNLVEVGDMFEDIDDTEQYDVMSLIKSSPNLSTFVKLIEQADMVDDLQRVDKLTLFAPTNEAFSKIPEEKLESFLMPENKALLYRVLQAHVLPSDVSSAQLEDNTRIQMSEDSYIPVERRLNGSVTTVGGAQVVKNDIEASNGRIHVIDAVIMPTENVNQGTLR